MTPKPTAHPGGAPVRVSALHHGHHRANRRGFLYTRTGVWTVRVITFVVLIGAWELYASGVSRALFAPPSAILESIIELTITEGTLWGALAISIGALILLTLTLVTEILTRKPAAEATLSMLWCSANQ